MANYTSDFTGQHNDDYDSRITSLLNTVQEQQSTILTLTNRISTLETNLTTVTNDLATYKSYPHVIEAGGSGITTSGGYWHKWNTGLKEWWAIVSTSQGSYYTQPGTGFLGYSNTVYFPSGLFTSAPHVLYSGHIGNGFVLTGTQLNGSVTKDYVTFYALSSASGTQTAYWRIYAFGV